MPERAYSANQVADLLGVSPAEVAQWIQKGLLPFHRLPEGGVRITDTNLIQFLRNSGVDVEAIASGLMTGGQTPAPATVPGNTDAKAAGASARGNSPDVAQGASQGASPGIALENAATAARQAPPGAPLSPSLSSLADGPAGQVAQAILQDALSRGASDILLEGPSEGLTLRMRIDGVLHERSHFKARLPQTLGPQLIAQFRRLARLDPGKGRDIAEGSFTLSIDGRDVNFRLLTCPTAGGERLAIQVVGDGPAMPLSQLGLSSRDQAAIRLMLDGGGLIVVAGPSRSGRSTTLAAMLKEFGGQRDVVAVARKQLPLFEGASLCLAGAGSEMSQVQAVRALAAQGADMLVIDEIRDGDTLPAALETGIEGTLVLAGVRADDCLGALKLLREAEPDGWAMSLALRGIIAQRLVRRICDPCKQGAIAPPGLLEEAGLAREQVNFPLYQGQGCNRCLDTGCRGRTGLFSVLSADEDVAAALRAGADAPAVIQAAAARGMKTMLEDGIAKMRSGLVSLEELSRALGRGARPS